MPRKGLFYLFLLILFTINTGFPASQNKGTASAAADFVFFPATGHYLSGEFLTYWQDHGALSLFGYPLSEPMQENGYTVQYFERNRFEYHPEYKGTPYAVLLGLLGVDTLKNQTLPLEANLKGGFVSEDSNTLYFKETNHTLRGTFRHYWESHGGLAIFGYPLTEEFSEANASDGKTYTVQYFERNRFEYHPENSGTPYDVLLGLLGVSAVTTALSPELRMPLTPLADGRHPSLTITGTSTTGAPLDALISTTPGTTAYLKLYDLAGHAYGNVTLNLPGNDMHLLVYPYGKPGPQSATLFVDDKPVAQAIQTFSSGDPLVPGIATGDVTIDALYPTLRGYVEANQVDFKDQNASGSDRFVHGYRTGDLEMMWLRDHTYQARAFRYFDPNLKSAADYYRRTQHPDGSFEDFFLALGDGDHPWHGRSQVEADLEYLYVQLVYTVWQATGDDDWLRLSLPAAIKGIDYTMTSPIRWDPSNNLVKRPFTIDTWDFEYGPGQLGPDGAWHPRQWIDSNTKWGIMHGDNTGLFQSLIELASMEKYLGNQERSTWYHSQADGIAARLNAVAWNGRFYTHQVHLTPLQLPFDESNQLSLSNTYALTRGTLTQEQAASIIREYQQRGKNGDLADWRGIDPPFPVDSFATPAGSGKSPGEYVNGGVLPLVGGALADGAFAHGFENYGVEILKRYAALINKSGGSYLWYYPDGTPGRSNAQSTNTDGWGSAEMFNALSDGLAGVHDNGKLFTDVTLSPRWIADNRPTARVMLTYPASGAFISYSYNLDSANRHLTMGGSGNNLSALHLHILLPPDVAGLNTLTARLNGANANFTLATVEKSTYLDLYTSAGNSFDLSISW